MNDDSLVAWKPQYSVNIEAIDRQHQGLVDLIRQLQEAMWEGRGQAFQRTLLDRLVDYTQVHFAFEEKLLQERAYESLAEHVEQHRMLTSQVRDLQQRMHEGKVISNASMMLFLRHWLIDHILEQDQKYARALNSVT
jgi:hemerythrin